MAAVLLQVTLGAGATQVSTRGIGYRQLIAQNNAASNCRLGDFTVSASKGLLMVPGASINFGAVNVQLGTLSDLWLFGTQGQVIDFFYHQA